MEREKSENQIKDEQLIEQIKAGSEKAFTELYERYQSKIHFHFLKLTNNNVELSEDLSIDLFTTVHSKLELYDDGYAFSTWLFRMAKNKFIDNVRKKKIDSISIDKYTDEEETEFQLVGDSPTPEQLLMIEERNIQIRSFLENIKGEKMRTLAKMRYLKEMSYEEISEETGITLNTVKGNLLRARQNVEEQIKRVKFDITPIFS